jgi:zinc finger protein
LLKVASKTDLFTRVVRSSTSTLSIPELDLLVEPGRALDGYVTNVEGVLRRLLEIVKTMERDLDDDIERQMRAKEISDRLVRIISGDFSKDDELTLILEDPKGNGLMVSPEGRVIMEPIGTGDMDPMD